jgi:steroid 5-alpha reductase family enzyme
MDVGLVFALCWGVTVAMQCLFFAIAFLCAFDKVTDLAGSANFIVLALLTIFLAPSEFTTRQIVLTSLVCVTRLELGAYLLYRVLKRGKDSRFDELRANCLKFFGFWVFQMLWVYLVSAPLIYVNASDVDPPLGPADYVGWAMVAVGFVFQVAADMQKNSFRSDPANAKKVCRVGVWYYSRHPNFAGEILLWWGVYLGACPVFIDGAGTYAGFATVVSPLFTMWVLLGLTGIPLAEGSNSNRWYDGGEAQREYELYFDSTPPLWPFPPFVYRRMPLLLKRLLCFELPSYAYRGDEESATIGDAQETDLVPA